MIRRLRRRLGEAWTKAQAWGREAAFPLTVRRLSGPQVPDGDAGRLIVVCLVRDGRVYIEEFLRHYRELGALHMVFLDNGSTDGTAEALAAGARGDVTVLQTLRPYKVYKDIMKRFLVTRFGRRSWVLCVDIDELFDYPLRAQVPLPSLLRYLNANGYTAMAAQLLDLFPQGAITAESGMAWRTEHRFYDISDLEKAPYGKGPESLNTAPDVALEVIHGGVRWSQFKVKPMLTKHPLLFPGRGLHYFNAHYVQGARVADVSGVLQHYKYAGDFAAYARRIVQEGSFWQGSAEYKAYLREIETDMNLSLFTDTACEWVSVEHLLSQELLVASEAFRAWPAHAAAKPG